jgi:hypothetical protein
MSLTVFLADLVGGIDYPSPVRYTLQNLFDKAAPGKVKVQWTSAKPH